jgi:hypothetical protein
MRILHAERFVGAARVAVVFLHIQADAADAGIGFGRILQLQAGIGNRGPLGRIRTDINLRSIREVAGDFILQDNAALEAIINTTPARIGGRLVVRAVGET